MYLLVYISLVKIKHDTREMEGGVDLPLLFLSSLDVAEAILPAQAQLALKRQREGGIKEESKGTK